jgi:membrane-associated phospholipid phosphatase
LFQTVWAQLPENNCQLNATYLKSYISDSKQVVTAPLRWNAGQYAAAALVTSGVVALAFYDDAISKYFLQNQTSGTKQLSTVLRPLGNEWVVLGGSAGLYVMGQFIKKEKASCAGLQNIKAVLISSAFIFGVKHLTHRSRPFMNEGSNNWNVLSNQWNYTSFPSGHSTFAFATATTFSSMSKKKMVPIIAYSIASGVALSRIHDQKHWASDVLAGAAIGTAFSLTVNKPFR